MMLVNYLKLAWRNLQKSKGYAAINILGLALGMAVAILIGIWVYDELSYDKYHKNYDRIGQLLLSQSFSGHRGTGEAISLPIRKVMEDKYKQDYAFISLSSWTQGHVLGVGDKRINSSGNYAEPGFPEMMSFRILHGAPGGQGLKEVNSIMLNETTAKALFGKSDVVGKMVKVDNRFDVMVTAVYEDLPANTTLNEVAMLMPWAHYVANEEWVRGSQDQWLNHSFQLFAMLAPNTSFEAANRRIRDEEKPFASKEIQPDYFLHPMADWHLRDNFNEGKQEGGRITYVWMFAIIGGFVLLLACINFMNLSTARSERRSREVGIRKTLGSNRWQLITQFYGESFLLTLISFVLAMVLVALLLPLFGELAGKENLLTPWGNPWFWVIMVVFIIITALLAGSYPALYLSGFEPLRVLKGTFQPGKYSSLPRKVLVVLQFTISIALIIGTLVVFRQISHAKERTVGYNRQGLLHVDITMATYQASDALMNELMATGAVEAAAKSSSPVTAIWSNQDSYEWPGKDPNQSYIFGTLAVGFNYGKTVGWNMVAGRDFSKEFASDSVALILNESAVKQMGLTNAIGATVKYDSIPHTIIGVVKDMVMESPYEPTRPVVWIQRDGWVNMVNIRLKPGMPLPAALAAVEKVYKKLDPDTPFTYHFADEDYDNKFRAEQRIGKLAAVFAGIAIFISCLGLFALASFMAERRTKEIGIRKVLGSSVSQIWGLLSKEFLWLTCLSIALATPLAWVVMRNWLKGFEYRSELSWWLFAITGLLAIAITIITVSFQAIRAAHTNPVKSLRSE